MARDTNQAPVNFIVSVHSARWRSQIEKQIAKIELPLRIHWALDLDSACGVATKLQAGILLAELPESYSAQPELTLASVGRFANNSQRCPIFLFGDSDDEGTKQALSIAGASDSCFSMLDIGPIWARIRRHLAFRPSGHLSVENSVIARLPW